MIATQLSRGLALVLTTLLILPPTAQAWGPGSPETMSVRNSTPSPAEPVYALKVRLYEARETLNAYLQNFRIRQRKGQPVSEAELRNAARLLRSYRTGSAVSQLPIWNAPFTGALMLDRFEGIWKAEYDRNWNLQYEKNVVNLRLETLFDSFMEMIVKDELPDSMKEDGKKIGKCLARKVLDGRVKADAMIDDEEWTRRECPLDPSTDRFKSVGLPKLIWMKMTCGLPTPSPCFARKALYNYVKRDLLAARSTPAVQDAARTEFEKQFPPEFRKGFLEEIGNKLKGLPELVSAKFKGEVNAALWSSNTALVDALTYEELGGPGSGLFNRAWSLPGPLHLSGPAGFFAPTFFAAPGAGVSLLRDSGDDLAAPAPAARETGPAAHLTMKDFSEGLRADAGLAAVLVQTEDARLRGVAAPLFYAAANRLLLMTGGKRARFDGRRLVLAEGDQYDERDPKRAPVLADEVFGGWGVEQTRGRVFFSAWDWANYDPAKKLRLFPNEFLVGEAGRPRLMATHAGGLPVPVPPVETLDDLVDLISASALFFDVTRIGSRLSTYMGTEEQLSEILEPASPVLFPREGRMLMIAVIGAALQNAVAGALSHVAATQPGSEDGPAGVAFYDKIRFAGRGSAKSPVKSVAKLIITASRLKRALHGDPMVPEALRAQMGELDRAIINAGLALLATGVEADGAFRELLMTPQTRDRRIMTTVRGLEAIIQTYSTSSMPIVMTSIAASLQYLDRVWGGGLVPPRMEGSTQAMLPSELWALVNFWDEYGNWLKAQERLRGTDWIRWEKRIERLRDALLRQFDETEGPRPLGA